MNCDTFFKVCFKESTLTSETCYNTTEPTGDNTTFIPFTTPNIVLFYTNTLCEAVSTRVLPNISQYIDAFSCMYLPLLLILGSSANYRNHNNF